MLAIRKCEVSQLHRFYVPFLSMYIISFSFSILTCGAVMKNNIQIHTKKNLIFFFCKFTFQIFQLQTLADNLLWNDYLTHVLSARLWVIWTWCDDNNIEKELNLYASINRNAQKKTCFYHLNEVFFIFINIFRVIFIAISHTNLTVTSLTLS
jgi:hypothetical protein